MVHRPLLFALCAALAAGCAARAVGAPDDGGDARADGRVRFDGGPFDDAAPDVRYRDVPTDYDVFREDACPADSGGGVRAYDCDPFNPTTSCPAGQGCYPYTEYPTGRCGREVYRAQCFAAGRTSVDGFCTGGTDCAPGLACFATGAGNRCLRLCRLDGGEPRCPRGSVCEPTDLVDFGACD